MNKTRFTTKVLLSLLVVMVILGSVVTVASAADAFKNYNLAYGEIVPTDAKLEKQVFTYNLYGDSDDIYFMRICKGKENAFFGIEIYSDKNYQTQIRSYAKEYGSSVENKPLKVTWDFKSIPSGTYYGRCYTFVEIDDVKTIDTSSLKTFVINVDRISKKSVELKSITNSANGPKITWTPFSTATEYYVYRKGAGVTSWTRIATLGAKTSTYTDKTAKSGYTYTYTVKCREGNAVSLYDKTGLSTKYIAMPIVSVNGNGAAGNAKVSWKAIPGATGYYVYRKGGSLSDYTWQRIANIKNGKTTSYIDKAATSTDWQYSYTVKAYNGKNLSAVDMTGVDFDYIPAPTLTKLTPILNGMKLEWKSSNTNVIEFIVYRKNATSWERIGTTTEKSFVDTNAVSGKTYTYTVKAVSDTNAGAYSNTGISSIYLDAPVLVKPTFDSNYNTKVQWEKVPGATGYRVYRKINDDKSWTHIATIKSGSTTKYTDKCEKTSGYSYTYTVRAFDSKNVFSSYYSAGATGICLGKPDFTAKQKITDDGSLCIETSWNAIDGATKYNVYRRIPGGSWTTIAVGITETNYLDYTVECGILYEYAVRSFNDSGDCSTYLTREAIALIIPELDSVTVTENGCELVWDAIENADLYTIYRRAKDSAEWKKIATTETNGFTDVYEEGKAEPFYYTISATFGEIETQYYDGLANFIEIELTTEFIPATDDAFAYIAVDFDCPDATSIEVYKAVNDEEPILLDAISSSFTDNGIEEGNDYTYTVIAKADGKATNSESSVARYPHPHLADVIITDFDGFYNNNEPYAQITWDSVEFAEEYVILRKYQNETEWTEISKVAVQEGALSYTYTDEDLLTEVYYEYAVKAISSDSDRGASTSEQVIVFIATPLDAVTGLKIESPEKQDDGTIKIRISWEPTKYAETYKLYRNNEIIKIYSNEDALEYIDFVDVNVEYTYTVVASAPDRGVVSNEEKFIFVDENITPDPDEPVDPDVPVDPEPEDPHKNCIVLTNAEIQSLANDLYIITDVLMCTDFSDIAVSADGYTIEAVKEETAYYGTGTVINVLKDGEIVKTYTLIVKTDINGDGYCDVLDYAEMEKFVNAFIGFDDLQLLAGDLDNDGDVNYIDYELFEQLLTN